MSRQLDLQLYLALHGYPLKDIPEERLDDYMREPHYSTDAEAMLELDMEMRKRGWSIQITHILPENKYEASYEGDYRDVVAVADTMQLAVSLAAYEALTEEEWEE